LVSNDASHAPIFFSLKTLTKLLKKTGFDLVDVKYIGKTVEIRWILFKLANITNNKILLKIYHSLKETKIGKTRLRVNLFDIMTITAKKIRKI
jgi:hypothetical protein